MDSTTWRRLVGMGAAVAVAGTMLIPAPATAGSAAVVAPASAPAVFTAPSVVGFPIPQYPLCRRPLNRLELFRSSSRYDYPNRLTILDQTVRVALDNIDLFTTPYNDPSRRLWFRSLLWATWRATLMIENGNIAPAREIAEAVKTAVEDYPDPGSATPAQLAMSNAVGWDEGTALRRTEALLCLTRVTGRTALEPLLRMHGRALLDPNRYMGPPNRSVHNHGLLTNLVLLDLGDYLDEPVFVTVALNRMRNEYNKVFSPGGWAFESSSHYHGVNYLGWTEAEAQFRRRGFTADADRIAAVLADATTVSAHLIGPTGTPVLIGNSRADDGFLRPRADRSRPLTLVDPVAGVGFGRFSWTDRGTSAWSAMNRPKRGAHGHDDELAVTWQSAGVPILIDPGQHDYEKDEPLTVWDRSPDAHNTSVPVQQGRDRDKVSTISSTRTGEVDVIEMSTSARGPLQSREVVVDDRRATLAVSDEVPGGQTQHWHLDPRWQVQRIAGDRAELVDTDGRVLTVQTTPGSTITAYRGSRAPVAGWYSEGFEQTVPALELVIGGGRALDTLFRLQGGSKPEPPAATVERSSVPGNRQVELHWRVEGKARVTGFRIQARAGKSAWNTVVPDTGSAADSAVVSGLENGVRYRFRVASLAKRTHSDFGRPSRALVPFTRPGRVSTVTATPAGTKKAPAAALAWLPPADDGGRRVKRYEVKSTGTPWTEVRGPAITLPMPNDALTARIRAVNDAGAGKKLRAVVYRAMDGTLTVG